MKKVSYTYAAEGSKAKHKGVFFVENTITDEEVRDIIHGILGFELKIKIDPGYSHHGYGIYEKIKMCEEEQKLYE